MPRKWCARTQPMASPNSLEGRLPGDRIDSGSVVSEDAGIACEPTSGLRQQQDFPGGAAGLETAVRLSGLVERQLEPDADLERAGVDPAQHVAGAGKQLGAG